MNLWAVIDVCVLHLNRMSFIRQLLNMLCFFNDQFMEYHMIIDFSYKSKWIKYEKHINIWLRLAYFINSVHSWKSNIMYV